jgi:hypothetical protein
LAKIVIAFYFFQKNLSAVYDDTFVCFFLRSGDIRNGIMPKKPERSASMRTRERSMPYDSLPLESKQVCRIWQFVFLSPSSIGSNCQP